MYKGDLVLSTVEFQCAHDAAAQSEPRWNGREITYWSEWREGGLLRHAVMLLDDGTRLVIHEEASDIGPLDERR